MTPWEKLEWMRANCHTLHIDANDHRSYYETVAGRINCGAEEHLFDDDDAEVRDECIRRNEVVTVQVYPITPIGFYRVAHYDLGAAIERAYDCVINEVGRPASPDGSKADG